MKFDEIFHDQMEQTTETFLNAALFSVTEVENTALFAASRAYAAYAATSGQVNFPLYYFSLRVNLGLIGRGGFKGAEYLALIVRLTRRLNALRAQRDGGGMKGMSMLVLSWLNSHNLLAC